MLSAADSNEGRAFLAILKRLTDDDALTFVVTTLSKAIANEVSLTSTFLRHFGSYELSPATVLGRILEKRNYVCIPSPKSAVP